MKHLTHLKHTLATCVFSTQCHLVAWTNRGARRRRNAWSSPVRLWARTYLAAWVSTCARCMSTLGEHLHEHRGRAHARRLGPAHPWRAPARLLSGQWRQPWCRRASRWSVEWGRLAARWSRARRSDGAVDKAAIVEAECVERFFKGCEQE